MLKLAHGLMLANALIFSGAAAEAKDLAYVGKWAKTKAACAKPSDTLDAPTIIKARSYDQLETHCNFTSVNNQQFGWRAKARCSVEGSTQIDTLTMTVTGTTLTYRWGQGGKSHVLNRC
jgi:hypothetical protein